MTIKLYQYSATPDRVDKTQFLDQIGTLPNVTLKADTDLMHPEFILKTDPKVYNANYLYCGFTKRYYYITGVTALSGGRVAIQCRIDVLYTYKQEIFESSGWVVASSGVDNSVVGYDMLHNDYPFREDYDVLGVDLSGNPIDNGIEGEGARHIFICLK